MYLILLLLLNLNAPPAEDPPREPIDRVQNQKQLRIGMTPAEVRTLLGPPPRVARQLLYRHYLEQWSYDDPAGLWLELDCHTGREPHVVAIHRSTDP